MITGTILLIIIYVTSIFSNCRYGKINKIYLIEKKKNYLFELIFFRTTNIIDIRNYQLYHYRVFSIYKYIIYFFWIILLFLFAWLEFKNI